MRFLKLFIFLFVFVSFFAKALTLLDGVSLAVSETPYSAVVIPIHYSQKVTEDNNESILTIQAKVVTPLRGNLPEIINFVAITDKNESLGHLGDKILLTFCSVDEKLYFAGVGAAFTPTDDLINHVKLIVKNLDDIQIKYDFCN